MSQLFIYRNKFYFNCIDFYNVIKYTNANVSITKSYIVKIKYITIHLFTKFCIVNGMFKHMSIHNLVVL